MVELAKPPSGLVVTVKETVAVPVLASVQTLVDAGDKVTDVAHVCANACWPKTEKIATYRSMATFDVIVLKNHVQVSYGLWRTLDSRPLAAPFLLLVEVTG